MYEAWNYVGYTSRKLGDYDKALLAYDQALRLNPSYNEAIGIAASRISASIASTTPRRYMQLFQSSRPLADQLMAEMQEVGRGRRAAGNAAPEVDALAQWIDERSNIARQTASLATDAPVMHSWN